MTLQNAFENLAVESKQDSQITILSAVSAKLPATLGAKASAASLSVVLASDQATIPVDIQDASISVTGPIAVTQATGTNLHTVVDSGTISTITNVVHIDDNAGSITVDGTVAVTGVATAANQTTANSSLSSIDGKITAVNTGAVVVSSSALPTGAATAAKQPALGTAGTASSDVITVQGKASMTPVLVDGSATTQPVSGTVSVTGVATAANQSTANTSLSNIDTNAGATSDAVVAAGATGSVSAKLRRLTTDIDAIKTSVAAATPAGSNVIGAVTQSGTWNVGTVSTITNVVHIDDNAGSITVDGTVAATQSGTWTVQPGNTANSTAWKVDGSAVTQPVGGNVAHDAVDSGNPQKMGAIASTSVSARTLVSSADRTDLVAGVDGVLIVRENANLEDLVSGNATNTDGTSTSVIAAQAAGIKTYITDITLTNTSVTNIYVEIKDGTTVKWTFPLPANGGVTHHFATPLAGTAATAWNYDPSAAATTTFCSIAGFKSKV